MTQRNNKYDNLLAINVSDIQLEFMSMLESSRSYNVMTFELIDDQLSFEISEPGYIKLSLPFDYADYDKVFCNGIQSWSASDVYPMTGSVPQLRPITAPLWQHYKMPYYGDTFLWKHVFDQPKLYSYGYGVLIGAAGVSRLEAVHTYNAEKEPLGSSPRSAEGLSLFVFELRKERVIYFLEVKPGEHILKISCHGKDKNILLQPPKTGWTSWYNYYTNINPEILHNVLDSYINEKIPIDYFQIDDGWQKAIGDWEENEKFNNGGLKDGHLSGLADIASRSLHQGIIPGLWLAPFIVEKASSILKDKPHWIKTYDVNVNKKAKNASTKKQIAGYNPGWSGLFFALDWEQEEVQKYLKEVFRRVIHDWGFKLLKLDFLYAAGFHQGLISGERYHRAITFIRSVTQGAELLLCGALQEVNTSPADYIRIGGDVALEWDDWRLSQLLRYRERVSTLATLKNTITRRLLGDYSFKLDPDVFILRDGNNKLNTVQKETLFNINTLLGDLLFTSDDISTYSRETLALYKSSFGQVVRHIKNWSLVRDGGWIFYHANKTTNLFAYNLSARPLRLPTPYTHQPVLLDPYASRLIQIAHNK